MQRRGWLLFAAPAAALFLAFWLFPMAELALRGASPVHGHSAYLAVVIAPRYWRSLFNTVTLSLVAMLGLTTGLIVAVAIIGTQAGYNYATQSELARNYAEAEQSGRLRFGESVWGPQRKALEADASWADVNKTNVRIPLTRALQIMVDSHGTPPGLPTAGAPTGGGGGNTNAAAPTSQPAHR